MLEYLKKTGFTMEPEQKKVLKNFFKLAFPQKSFLKDFI